MENKLEIADTFIDYFIQEPFFIIKSKAQNHIAQHTIKMVL